MTGDTFIDFDNLPHGLYKLFWKSGGVSLASVGSMADGERWFKPTNWTGLAGSTDWGVVSHVEGIHVSGWPTRSYAPGDRVQTHDGSLRGVVAAVWGSAGEATVRCEHNMTSVGGGYFEHVTVKLIDLRPDK